MTIVREYADGKLFVSCEDHIGILTIRNPGKKNAVNAAMWRAIPRVIDFLVDEAGARVAIVTGGEDFCAGADISEFAALREGAASARTYEAENSAAFAAIRAARVPAIAAISGICYGGGFGIAAACDLRIADVTARFAIPAAKLGLAYPSDAVHDIHRGLGDQMARKALYTGAVMSAHELRENGFLSEVTAAGQVTAAALSLAASIAANAPLSVAASKLALRAVAERDEALMDEAEILGAATFESADYAEGRAAFSARRRPVFKGI